MKRALCLTLLVLMAACKRETRVLEIGPTAGGTMANPPANTVWPGPTSNEVVTNFSGQKITNFLAKALNGEPAASSSFKFFQENGWSMSDAKRVYAAFNCVGCHAHGGGGMGPALMDQKWLYGSAPQDVFISIVEGRPNGMPAFRDRIPEYMVWQLVAYVRSMSGLAPFDAAPSRDDHMQTRLPENTIGAVQSKSSP